MKKSYKKSTAIFFLAIIGIFGLLFAGKPVLASEISQENILYLINKERIYYGLNPLRIDDDLNKASHWKSNDMIFRNYFEHYAYGLSPWDLFVNAGYEYSVAGENLAMDFETSEGIVDTWMQSPAHRQNLLNPKFEDLGIGIAEGSFLEGGKERYTKIVSGLIGHRKPKMVSSLSGIISTLASVFSWNK